MKYKGFRALRGATKGATFGYRVPFEKGSAENFLNGFAVRFETRRREVSEGSLGARAAPLM